MWKDLPQQQRMAAMRSAASSQNFELRVKDIFVVLDQLARWNHTDGQLLENRLNLGKVAMSGHSFGAMTTQAVSGQTNWRGKKLYTDERIKAAIIFSPSSPRHGVSPEKAFDHVTIPWMLMTGTHDIAPIGGADIQSRLAVFLALPVGGKYEVVLYGAEHSAFTDSSLPWEREKRNPNHHRVLLALTTAFLDAYIQNNPVAKNWLDGNGAPSVLEQADRWQKK